MRKNPRPTAPVARIVPIETQMIEINDLKSLAGVDGPCLSVFQPLRDTFSQVTKTDTRLVAAARRRTAC